MNTTDEKVVVLPSEKTLSVQLADMERMVPIEHFWSSVSSAIIALANRRLTEDDLAKHLADAVKHIPVDGAILRPLACENMSYVITGLVPEPSQQTRVLAFFEKAMGY